MPKKRHWHMVGQGAISSFCAANALAHDHNVTVLGRCSSLPVKVDRAECETKYLVHINQTRTPLPLLSTVNDNTRITNLLIAVKAYDVVPALKTLLSRLTTTANLVLCHNGLGTIEPVLSLLAEHPHISLYFCTTSSGAHVNNNEIIVAAIGDTYWQNVWPESSQIATQNPLGQCDFESLFIQAQPANDLPLILWRKLLINCAINPLTALHQIKNGDLAQADFSLTILSIIEEVVKVAGFEGVTLDVDEMTKLVYDVIHSTANNRSSMCQDVAKNKPTEIDFINGYVTKLGITHKVATPINDNLVTSIRNIATKP